MNELLAAYQATTYRVFLGEDVCDLRIAQVAEKMCHWLETTGAVTFALVTADNPASRRLSPAENRLRHAVLQEDLRALALPFFVAENRPDEASWPVEIACCVMGMTLDAALELGRRHGQNAIVFGGTDGLPQLYWIEKKNNG